MRQPPNRRVHRWSQSTFRCPNGLKVVSELVLCLSLALIIGLGTLYNNRTKVLMADEEFKGFA
jgi:hypothetical protein